MAVVTIEFVVAVASLLRSLDVLSPGGGPASGNLEVTGCCFCSLLPLLLLLLLNDTVELLASFAEVAACDTEAVGGIVFDDEEEFDSDTFEADDGASGPDALVVAPVDCGAVAVVVLGAVIVAFVETGDVVDNRSCDDDEAEVLIGVVV